MKGYRINIVAYVIAKLTCGAEKVGQSGGLKVYHQLLRGRSCVRL